MIRGLILHAQNAKDIIQDRTVTSTIELLTTCPHSIDQQGTRETEPEWDKDKPSTEDSTDARVSRLHVQTMAPNGRPTKQGKETFV